MNWDITEEERAELRKAHDNYAQSVMIRALQEDIDNNKRLIEILKSIINHCITKENYTQEDEDIVGIALQVIASCNDCVTLFEKEILDFVKYPVGSKRRPYLIKH